MAQVQNWFINSRKRHLLPQLEQGVQAEEPKTFRPALQTLALQNLPKMEPQMALEVPQGHPRVPRQIFSHPGMVDQPRRFDSAPQIEGFTNTSALFNQNQAEQQARMQVKSMLIDSLAVPRPKMEHLEPSIVIPQQLQLPRLQELVLPHLAGKPFVCLDSKSLEVLKKLSTTGRQSYDTGDPAEAVQLQPGNTAATITALRDHGLSGLQRYLDTLGLLGPGKAGS